MRDKIEIPISKTKLVLLLLGAMAFVALGALFIINPDLFARGPFRSPEFIRIAGVAAVVFFGLCLLFIVRKFFNSGTGLIIDRQGITDNSSAVAAGFIPWEDITGIETLQIASTKILMLYTNRPEKYMERAGSGLRKRAMKANYKMYGSPLSITSNSLKIGFKELEQLLAAAYEQSRKGS